MNSLIDNDDEFARGDREVTLSTGAILGIFLGLVLLCGVFFGFGYKMGSRKSGLPPDIQASNAAVASSAPTADFNAFKPAAGSPATNAAPRVTVVVPPGSANSTGSNPSAPAVIPSRPAVAAEPSSSARSTPAANVHPATPAATNSAPSVGGNFVVQVAAVSLQEDADLLVGALRSKGYSVTTHAQPDKLIHIQVGPFSNRKDADTMRQRLLADGYNAIVK